MKDKSFETNILKDVDSSVKWIKRKNQTPSCQCYINNSICIWNNKWFLKCLVSRRVEHYTGDLQLILCIMCPDIGWALVNVLLQPNIPWHSLECVSRPWPWPFQWACWQTPPHIQPHINQYCCAWLFLN